MNDLELARQRAETAERDLKEYAQYVQYLTTALASGHFKSRVLEPGVYEHWLKEVRDRTLVILLPPVPDLTEPPTPETMLNEQLQGEGQKLEGASEFLHLIGSRFTAPVYTVTILAGRVVVRVDDEKNKLAWVELGIDEQLVGVWFRTLGNINEEDPEEQGQFEEPADGQ